MARAQQQPLPGLVQPDRAAEVGAQLGVRDEVAGGEALPPLLGLVDARREADEQRRGVGGVDVALGERGDRRRRRRARRRGIGSPCSSTRRRPPRLVRRLLQAVAGVRAERADGEDRRQPEAGEGAGGQLGQEASPGDALGALLEVGDEGVDVVLVGRDLAPRLLERALGHEALGPDDDAGADAAEDDEQQQPFELGLTALPVHDEEADRGEDRRRRRRRPAPFSALLSGGLARAAGARRQARRCFPTIQKHSATRPPSPNSSATKPSVTGPKPLERQPPAMVGILEVLDVGGDVVGVLGRELARVEHGHLSRPDPHRLDHLGRRRLVQRRRVLPVAQRAAVARRLVARRAVGPEQDTAVRQVGAGEVDLGDGRARRRARRRRPRGRRSRRGRRRAACGSAGTPCGYAAGMRPVVR